MQHQLEMVTMVTLEETVLKDHMPRKIDAAVKSRMAIAPLKRWKFD
ncbi:hypothetical protein [Paraburkholderia monticola]|nr:hypothetical protein [Paraburkholderia monticola]